MLRKNFGENTMAKEAKLALSILFLFGVMTVAIIIGSGNRNLSFNLFGEAAGKTYFVANADEFQDALIKSADNDAIFLKVGTYLPKDSSGFLVKNKNIRLLGAGSDFVNISATNRAHGLSIENSSVEIDSMKVSGANQDGILIKNSSSQEVVVRNSEISQNSGAGVNSDKKLSIHKSLISQNANGILLSGGDLSITNSVIQKNSKNGISVGATTGGAVNVENSIFSDNKGTGILLDGGNNNTLRNITVVGNENGIIAKNKTNILNSIVQNSAKKGIDLKSIDSIVTYTNSFGNKEGDFTPDTLKSSKGNLSVNSKFVSATNFHLAPDSSLVDKGSESEKDNDNSRMDMGAFGGNPAIEGVNSAPIITSSPPSYVKVGQLYSYEIIATDPDKDSLDYIVLNSNIPGWLKQNNNKFSGVPTASDVGFAGLSVVVTDRKGHNVVHPISISVVGNERVIPTPLPTGTTPTPTTTPPVVTNPLPQISILSPNKDTVFDKDQVELKWSIQNNENIEKIVIKYSSDKENFDTIATLPKDKTSYNWDISQITPGKYILKVEVYEKNNSKPFAKQSDEFEIKRTVTDIGIVITKISPQDNQIVNTRRPTIQVEFTPKVDIDKTKSSLKIKGQSVEFESTQGTIYHTPAKDLTGGTVDIEVKIVAKDGKEASRKWIFKLPANTVPQDTTPEVTQVSKILGLPRTLGLILLGILIFGLLLLILYFVLRLIRTIREDRQGDLEEEFTDYYHQDTQQMLSPDSSTQTTILETTDNPTPINNTTTTTTQENIYLAHPDENKEYIVNDVAPLRGDVSTQASTNSSDSTSVLVDYSQPQTVIPTETTTTTTTNVTLDNQNESRTIPIEENTYLTSSSSTDQDNSSYVQYDNLNYSNNNSNSTVAVAQEIQENPTVVSETSISTQNNTTEEIPVSSEFVQKMMDKYDIKPEDIKNVETTTTTTTTTNSLDQISDNLNNNSGDSDLIPDPSKSSISPRI